MINTNLTLTEVINEIKKLVYNQEREALIKYFTKQEVEGLIAVTQLVDLWINLGNKLKLNSLLNDTNEDEVKITHCKLMAEETDKELFNFIKEIMNSKITQLPH
jgi:hypothetical protein